MNQHGPSRNRGYTDLGSTIPHSALDNPAALPRTAMMRSLRGLRARGGGSQINAAAPCSSGALSYIYIISNKMAHDFRNEVLLNMPLVPNPYPVAC